MTLRRDLATWTLRNRRARQAFDESMVRLARHCGCGRRKPYGSLRCIRCVREAA